MLIQVDVRDHEKLCGEPIDCKCGLKFAFKCNVLVAHKKAHPACQENHSTTENADEDSGSITRDNSTRRAAESTRPVKQAKYEYPPAPEFKGVPQVDASSAFKAGYYDFAGLRFSTKGGALWGSNMHYPSTINCATLPSIPPGGLEQLGSQIYNVSHPSSSSSSTRPVLWSSIPGL